MKLRLYFDTSVFGGVYDEEFEEISTLLFEKVKLGQIICVYSDLSETELENAPKRVKDFFADLPKEHLLKVEVTEEAFELAQKLMCQNIILVSFCKFKNKLWFFLNFCFLFRFCLIVVCLPLCL